MPLDEALGDTLALVNAARMAFGQDVLTDLPDSRPGDSADCLFYRALAPLGCTGVSGGSMTFDDPRKASYIGSIWGVQSDGRTVHHPGQFTEVIGRFDRQGLEHYETQDKPHF